MKMIKSDLSRLHSPFIILICFSIICTVVATNKTTVCGFIYSNIKYTINLSHTHSFTPSGTVTSTFTGTAGTTGGSTANTANTTPTFTGTAGTTGASGTGNTGSTGGGQAHNNMPPYVVKYCWERVS